MTDIRKKKTAAEEVQEQLNEVEAGLWTKVAKRKVAKKNLPKRLLNKADGPTSRSMSSRTRRYA